MQNKLFLFVDFNGVLATIEDWIVGDSNDRFSDIRNKKIQAIETLIKRDFKGEIYFVPISAWAHAFQTPQMLQEFLKERQVSFLPFEEQHIIENHSGEERINGIKDFIKKFNVEHYVILDDENNKEYEKGKLNYIPYDCCLAKYFDNIIKYMPYNLEALNFASYKK